MSFSNFEVQPHVSSKDILAHLEQCGGILTVDNLAQEIVRSLQPDTVAEKTHIISAFHKVLDNLQSRGKVWLNGEGRVFLKAKEKMHKDMNITNSEADASATTSAPRFAAPLQDDKNMFLDPDIEEYSYFATGNHSLSATESFPSDQHSGQQDNKTRVAGPRQSDPSDVPTNGVACLDIRESTTFTSTDTPFWPSEHSLGHDLPSDLEYKDLGRDVNVVLAAGRSPWGLHGLPQGDEGQDLPSDLEYKDLGRDVNTVLAAGRSPWGLHGLSRNDDGQDLPSDLDYKDLGRDVDDILAAGRTSTSCRTDSPSVDSRPPSLLSQKSPFESQAAPELTHDLSSDLQCKGLQAIDSTKGHGLTMSRQLSQDDCQTSVFAIPVTAEDIANRPLYDEMEEKWIQRLLRQQDNHEYPIVSAVPLDTDAGATNDKDIIKIQSPFTVLHRRLQQQDEEVQRLRFSLDHTGGGLPESVDNRSGPNEPVQLKRMVQRRTKKATYRLLIVFAFVLIAAAAIGALIGTGKGLRSSSQPQPIVPGSTSPPSSSPSATLPPSVSDTPTESPTTTTTATTAPSNVPTSHPTPRPTDQSTLLPTLSPTTTLVPVPTASPTFGYGPNGCALEVDASCVASTDGLTPCEHIDPQSGGCEKAVMISFAVTNTGSNTLTFTDITAEVNSETMVPTNTSPNALSPGNTAVITVGEYSFNTCGGDIIIIEVEVYVQAWIEGDGIPCEDEFSFVFISAPRRVETVSPTITPSPTTPSSLSPTPWPAPTQAPSPIPSFTLTPTFPPVLQTAVPTTFEPELAKGKNGLSSVALISLIAVAFVLVLGMACLGVWYYSQTTTVEPRPSFRDDDEEQQIQQQQQARNTTVQRLREQLQERAATARKLQAMMMLQQQRQQGKPRGVVV